MTTTMATTGIMTNDSSIDAWSHYKNLWADTMVYRRMLHKRHCNVYLVLLIDGICIEHTSRSLMREDERMIFDSMVSYVSHYMTTELHSYATQNDHEMRWCVEGWDFSSERRWE